MIDHKFVTGVINGTDFPAFAFRPFVTEQKIWVAFCRKHIGNILDVFKIACELDALFKSRNCLWSALCVNPCNVVRVANPQYVRWNGIRLSAFAGSFCLIAYGSRYLRWHNIHERLSILEYKGIQKNQCPDSIRNLIGDASNDTTSIRMTAENYIRKLFPLNEIRDIGDMGREIDSRRIEVRPFAQASKGRCEHVVPGRLKRRSNVLPTPASVPGAVDEDISYFVVSHEV